MEAGLAPFVLCDIWIVQGVLFHLKIGIVAFLSSGGFMDPAE